MAFNSVEHFVNTYYIPMNLNLSYFVCVNFFILIVNYLVFYVALITQYKNIITCQLPLLASNKELVNSSPITSFSCSTVTSRVKEYTSSFNSSLSEENFYE